MSYLSIEASVEQAQPIHFFEFVTPAKTYRYNDSDRELEFEGQTYLPLQIDFDEIETAIALSQNERVAIRVPFDVDLALDTGYLVTPDLLRVQIRRAHAQDLTSYQRIWSGEALRFTTQGLLLVIETQFKLVRDFGRPLLRAFYQRVCNYRLYDERCKASKAAHTTSTEIISFSDLAVVVLDDGAGDTVLTAGEIRNKRTGEIRVITNNISNTIGITHPFSSVMAGDEVDLSLGCLHNREDCSLKFANYENFGGFDKVNTTPPIPLSQYSWGEA